MTVCVNDSSIPATVGPHTSKWSHLFADTEEELHAFARILGLRREWFQSGSRVPGECGVFWHYDVTERKRQQAIRLGAIPVTWRHSPRIMRAPVALASQADHAAGLAWRAGDLDRAEWLIHAARQLDPGGADLWDKRQRTIESATRRAQKTSVSPRDTPNREESPGSTHQHQPQPSLGEELSGRLKAAGIDATDPGLAAIRQWNALAFRRADQLSSVAEAAGS